MIFVNDIFRVDNDVKLSGGCSAMVVVRWFLDRDKDKEWRMFGDGVWL